MSTSVLDITHLLAPINLESAVGNDLRQDKTFSSLYYQLKEARMHARKLERQQAQGIESSTKPDWITVQQLAITALSTQTKDLEIVVWLIEALLRQHGFAGLSDGFNLVREMLVHYWDEIYPLPDEEGLLTRLIPLIGLNGEETEGVLVTPIALVPLTQGQSAGPFALWQYQQALMKVKFATDTNQQNANLALDAITLDVIMQAVHETAPSFFQTQLQNLQGAIEALKVLSKTVEEKAPTIRIPISRILNQLNACIECIKVIAKDQLLLIDMLEESSNSILTTILVEHNVATLSTIENYSIKASNTEFMETMQLSREQVLQTLLSVADFFKRTEPHSLIPYMLEQAIKWSRTPFPNLLKELIKDEKVLGQFSFLTGINFEK